MNTNYHILYYSWDEYTYEDCIECMRQLGYTVDVITGSMKDYGVDEQFFSKIKNYPGLPMTARSGIFHGYLILRI